MDFADKWAEYSWKRAKECRDKALICSATNER